MSYRVLQQYDARIPHTPAGSPKRAIVGHWSVGGTGYAGWRRTVDAVLIPSGQPGGRNVSYHEGWCWDGETFTVSRIVPPTASAHSQKPVPPPLGPWEPDATARALLGDGWRDPNRYAYAVCIAGGPADVAQYVKDPAFVAYAQRRLGELRDELRLPARPIYEHWRGQTNKTDWGRELTPLLYAEAETVRPFPVPERPAIAVIRGGSVLYDNPALEGPRPGNVELSPGADREFPYVGKPAGVAAVAYDPPAGDPDWSATALWVKPEDIVRIYSAPPAGDPAAAVNAALDRVARAVEEARP